MANENSPQDQSLLPHFADQAREKLEAQLRQAVAYDALSPDEKLELARILYR
jgi:hypothetical protein